MIKRIQFLTRRSELSEADFRARWHRAFGHTVRSATSDAPVRAVTCIVLHDVQGCEALYDAISMEWFESAESCRRAPSAVTSTAAEGDNIQWVDPTLAALVDSQASACVCVDEHILRGIDWLERRWADAAPKYKHMALARKAHGLSAAEFSERWRSRPGQLGGGSSGPMITIPDAARGHAYVQNHPRQPIELSAYDAINEVYFDDLSSMRARIEFFARHDLLKADSELISQTQFAVVLEHVISTRS